MNAIDRAGTFRGLPQDWGVSETKNGFPQFVFRVKATEYYDEEAGQYVPWADYDQDITGYLVLYTKDKAGAWVELLNAKQIKKVFGWTGLDFESLANGKCGETMILFRVEDSEYNGIRSLKMTWIDTADANPVKTLPKYDTDKLKGLTAKMGGALSATATPVAPASAPKGKPATPPKGKKARPKSDPVAEKPGAPSTATLPPASPATAPSAPSGAPAPTPETKDSAWAGVSGDLKDVTDEKLAEVWIAEVAKIGKDEKDFTPADWATVKEAVLKQTSKF
jgi:hypothetical protein